MQSAISSPIILNAGEARKQFGAILNRAYYAGETFIVERAGQPMIKIVPVGESVQQKEARERFWAFVQNVRQRLAQYDAQEVDAIFDEAIHAAKNTRSSQV